MLSLKEQCRQSNRRCEIKKCLAASLGFRLLPTRARPDGFAGEMGCGTPIPLESSPLLPQSANTLKSVSPVRRQFIISDLARTGAAQQQKTA
jgi:hypothetical protein